MGIRDYFRPVETMTAEEIREFLDKHKPGDYNLIDVRQPAVQGITSAAYTAAGEDDKVHVISEVSA